jgi:site-specific recombinase XerD
VRGLFRYLRLLEPGAFKLNPIEDAAPVRSGRRWFRRRGMLGHLPRSAGGPSSLQLPFVHRLPETVSPEGIAALQGSFRSMRDRAMASLMFLVGLRSCEVLSLRLGNVDLRSGMIRVCGKGSHERVVPVDPDVVRAIEHYVRTERPPTASDHVFVVQKGPNRGLPLKPAGLRTIFRYHRRRAGVPEARPHRLRHTFATNMIEAGMRLAELQAQLGHTNVESTGIYVHLAPATIRKAYLEALRRARKLRP